MTVRPQATLFFTYLHQSKVKSSLFSVKLKASSNDEIKVELDSMDRVPMNFLFSKKITKIHQQLEHAKVINILPRLGWDLGIGGRANL